MDHEEKRDVRTRERERERERERLRVFAKMKKRICFVRQA